MHGRAANVRSHAGRLLRRGYRGFPVIYGYLWNAKQEKKEQRRPSC
jgi:hypothetical protein